MNDLKTQQEIHEKIMELHLMEAVGALGSMIEDLAWTKEQLEKQIREGNYKLITMNSTAAGRSPDNFRYIEAMIKARCEQRFALEIRHLKE